MRRVADGLMKLYARLLIHVFFRTVEVEHSERLPTSGPVIVVANHLNGLVDGLLLIAKLARYPRFLGKATLFRVPVLWPLLKLAGVVPVYRAIDGAGTERNVGTFRRSEELLESGGVVGLFPEGISHNESTVQPLRTGAARIALGAAFDARVEGLVVVPVGLVYDNKARFRSRALVRIGEPLPIDGFGEVHAADSRQAARELTDRISTELAAVSPEYSSWSQAATLGRIADIAATAIAGDTALDPELAVRERLSRQLASRDVEPLVAALAEYERDLALLGLTDRQVRQGRSSGRWWYSMIWSLSKVLLAAPIALAGALVHFVPYSIVKVVATRPSNESMKSTVKLLGCVLLFLAVYLTLSILSLERFGVLGFFVTFAACPLAGYVTLRFRERARGIGGFVAAWSRLRARRSVVASVLDH